MDIIQELKIIEELHKDKQFFFGEVNFVQLAKDCRRKIEALQSENEDLKQELLDCKDPNTKCIECKKPLHRHYSGSYVCKECKQRAEWRSRHIGWNTRDGREPLPWPK